VFPDLLERDVMLGKTIRQTIVDELDFEPSVTAANIGVAVDHGVVTLTGHAASYAEKAAPERAVSRGEDARAIAKKIEVPYSNDRQTAGDQIAERALVVAIESRARARIRASRLQRFRELSATTA
jgi:BON domain